MVNRSFFDESKEQSLVKADIVAKYFWAWAKIMLRNAKNIAYIDLFSGPGRYKDGSKSTPLLILERAIADSEMRERLITFFNDVDADNSQSLQETISLLPNIKTLQHKPLISNREVGEEIVKQFEEMKFIPSLFFIDPWGYKGLSLRLIGSVIFNWGCDCIFFFNYNRINMGLNNQAVQQHINALFGEKRADELREILIDKTPDEREFLTVEAICQALIEIGGKYSLPFRFRNAEKKRTSHHLIFVSKNVVGYSIMKEIMAKESSDIKQGIASFEYNIAPPKYPLLYALSRPLDELGDLLLDEFAGQTIKMIDIFNRHHVGKPYIQKNYKDVLLKLEHQGKIITEPAKRRKNTFGDKVKVTFPLKQ
ncbi:three-Cys-motif partner protein TcmP [Spirulina sp. 06S082]|uniref:three-Cys-motif partner protein TcmP n=1 Tax=Spirulina sp. 06S082 TaxID=3110248 RepID=UPI002B20B8DD|nr:three-Cys-motif partner protein TcmP [Spirulina sp. 06S082]MEA5469055.1 three-Cys-motif partner protein TcmP [Spirulina sp. 06S082]